MMRQTYSISSCKKRHWSYCMYMRNVYTLEIYQGKISLWLSKSSWRNSFCKTWSYVRCRTTAKSCK
jgi:hypothetical protein